MRLSEHRQAVRKGDSRNGIAVYVQTTEHGINWEGASVRWKGTGFWQRRTAEAIHIRRSNPTMNLDSGLVLPMVWSSILDT